MKRSKKKLKIKSFIIFILVVLIMFLLFRGINFIKKDKKIYMSNIVGSNINDIIEEYNKNNISFNITYEYSYEYDKDIIISQNVLENEEIHKGDKIDIVVSSLKIDKEQLKNDKINELGNVPIMMYHGIKNMKNSETQYTGGNVDKDGYTRTSEAFRNDLEFYYEKGYRMVKLTDYINGNINVSYGNSPIILTFDDGNDNNIKVTGLDSDGNIIIDKDSAVGIMEEFKKKHADMNVTAIFFVTNNLFNQPEYNDKILHWLVDNGYEVGNHTKGHNDFTKIDTSKTQEVVGSMYQKLDNILGDKYSKIIALPFGSPYNKNHSNYKYIINGKYNDYEYNTIGALRVGWEPEVSPFNKNFDVTFMKRCRAYDNNGVEFDIKMVFNMLEKNKYISDGNIDTIVTSSDKENLINTNNNKKVILY